MAAISHTSTASLRVLPSRRTDLLLEHLEQLGLRALREKAYLVEEQGAPMRCLDQAGLGLAGVGERAPLEAEQLRLEQGPGNGGAVDVDERPRRAWAGAVNDPGEQALSGARFSEDQDRGVTAGALGLPLRSRLTCSRSRAMAGLSPRSWRGGPSGPILPVCRLPKTAEFVTSCRRPPVRPGVTPCFCFVPIGTGRALCWGSRLSRRKPDTEGGPRWPTGRNELDGGLGYLGLFLIGSISWLADHMGTKPAPASSPGRWPVARPSTRATDMPVIEATGALGRRRAA